eukprot:scaffold3.g6422.t1
MAVSPLGAARLDGSRSARLRLPQRARSASPHPPQRPASNRDFVQLEREVPPPARGETVAEEEEDEEVVLVSYRTAQSLRSPTQQHVPPRADERRLQQQRAEQRQSPSLRQPRSASPEVIELLSSDDEDGKLTAAPRAEEQELEQPDAAPAAAPAVKVEVESGAAAQEEQAPQQREQPPPPEEHPGASEAAAPPRPMLLPWTVAQQALAQAENELQHSEQPAFGGSVAASEAAAPPRPALLPWTVAQQALAQAGDEAPQPPEEHPGASSSAAVREAAAPPAPAAAVPSEPALLPWTVGQLAMQWEEQQEKELGGEEEDQQQQEELPLADEVMPQLEEEQRSPPPEAEVAPAQELAEDEEPMLAEQEVPLGEVAGALPLVNQVQQPLAEEQQQEKQRQLELGEEAGMAAGPAVEVARTPATSDASGPGSEVLPEAAWAPPGSSSLHLSAAALETAPGGEANFAAAEAPAASSPATSSAEECAAPLQLAEEQAGGSTSPEEGWQEQETEGGQQQQVLPLEEVARHEQEAGEHRVCARCEPAGAVPAAEPPEAPAPAAVSQPSILGLVQRMLESAAHYSAAPSPAKAAPAAAAATAAGPGAAAAAGAVAAAGPSRAPAAAGGADSAGFGGEGEPDGTNPQEMLEWLRKQIPQQLLCQYAEPHQVAPQDRAAAEERLRLYEAMVEEVRRSGRRQAKFDQVGASECRARYPDWPCWHVGFTHVPGIALGQRFSGRGPLDGAGVHTSYYGGISSSKEGARAIVLSGGYEDDTDHGDWLVYTGAGGRNKSSGGQISDQGWSAGNAALRENHLRGLPVRVCRRLEPEEEEEEGQQQQKEGQGQGGAGPKRRAAKKESARVYTYDGLYYVAKAFQAKGEAGHLVCKFWLVGIPGHYKANRAVSFVAARGFRNHLSFVEAPEAVAGPRVRRPAPPGSKAAGGKRAAAAAEPAPARKRRKGPAGKRGGRGRRGASVETKEEEEEAGSEEEEAPAAAPAAEELRPAALLRQDSAWLAGLRARPGLVLEDVSGGAEARKIPVFNEVDDAPPPAFTYVRESVVRPGSKAAALMAAASAVMPARWCGHARAKVHRGHAATWLPCGRALHLECLGMWECCAGCRRTPGCGANRRIAAGGIALPLELGVKSHGASSYLFDLDHFLVMYADPSTPARQHRHMPPLPPDPEGRPLDDRDHLVVDALSTGNVTRLINHSCEPNLVVQPVLSEGDSGLRYHIALIAACHIPAGVELCYSYGSAYQYKSPAGAGAGAVTCRCGSAKCRGGQLAGEAA